MGYPTQSAVTPGNRPCIRFLYVASNVCLHLPSDPASQVTPLLSANRFRTSRLFRDLEQHCSAPSRLETCPAHPTDGTFVANTKPNRKANPTDFPFSVAFKISDAEGHGEGAGDEAIKKAAKPPKKVPSAAELPTSALPSTASGRRQSEKTVGTTQPRAPARGYPQSAPSARIATHTTNTDLISKPTRLQNDH